MRISLSQRKSHKSSKINNISSTFYNNEGTKNIIPKKWHQLIIASNNSKSNNYYDNNTKYFKDEQKKYNNSPIHQYYKMMNIMMGLIAAAIRLKMSIAIALINI